MIHWSLKIEVCFFSIWVQGYYFCTYIWNYVISGVAAKVDMTEVLSLPKYRVFFFSVKKIYIQNITFCCLFYKHSISRIWNLLFQGYKVQGEEMSGFDTSVSSAVVTNRS